MALPGEPVGQLPDVALDAPPHVRMGEGAGKKDPHRPFCLVVALATDDARRLGRIGRMRTFHVRRGTMPYHHCRCTTTRICAPISEPAPPRARDRLGARPGSGAPVVGAALHRY